MTHTYDYPRPMLCVDMLVFNTINNTTYILLIKRLNNPYKDCWAFPGGFVDEDEALDKAAYRELEEECCISSVNLQQFRTYGDPGRDPRGHNVSVVYYSINSQANIDAKAADDAKELKWFKINEIPKLAFDHKDIFNEAVSELF